MTAKTEHLERELKFSLELDTPLPDLRALLGDVVRLPDQVLTTAYFDTSDLRLWERGVTLRHRSGEGDEHGVWTLKLPEGGGGPTLDRTELTWAAPRDEIPADVHRVLRGVLRKALLQEVVQLRSTRSRVRLCDSSALGELDDDVVTVIRGARKGFTFRQLEVELAEGADQSASKVIKSVLKALDRAGAHPDNEPKFAKSLGLAAQAGREPGRKKAQSGTLEGVVHRCIANGLGRLLDHDYLLRLAPSEPPAEAVHQARVATRRLRSDLRTFGSVLDPVWLRHATTDLQWVGQLLGNIRDLDILAQRLGADSLSLPFELVGREELHARVSRQRRVHSHSLEHALNSDRYLRLLGRLHGAVHAVPVCPPAANEQHPLRAGDRAAAVLPGLVRAQWAGVEQAVKKAGRHPSDRQLHKIRIRSKRLRYAAEAAQPTIGKAARRTASAAERLQTILGEHHDAVEAEAWLRREAATGNAVTSFAAGLLTARQQQDQQARRHQWRPVSRSLRTNKVNAWFR